MREMTKSILRFSWALPIFGINQLTKLSVPTGCNQDSTAQALDAVSTAAQGELGNTLKGVYDAGERLQRGLVDATFGVLLLDAFDPRRWLPGCGSAPVQPPGTPAAVQPPITPTAGGGQAQTGTPPPTSSSSAPTSSSSAPTSSSAAVHEPGWGPMP